MLQRKRSQETDVVYPPTKLRKPNSNPNRLNDDKTEGVSPPSTSRHSKKERKQNRSSRIHSLRKLLSRGTLPRNVQQEKERELAALLHDQERVKAKKEAKKVLERYHYVRFVERQKAEKRLKKLRKQLQAVDAEDNEELNSRIHEMEVNRHYAIYAPLDQKYISVFAEDQEENDSPGVLNKTKPPMWYVVENAMRSGQQELNALRDGRTKSTVSLNEESLPAKRRRQDPDLALKKDAKNSVHGQIKRRTEMQLQHEDSKMKPSDDDEMSDGGFFEK